MKLYRMIIVIITLWINFFLFSDQDQSSITRIYATPFISHCKQNNQKIQTESCTKNFVQDHEPCKSLGTIDPSFGLNSGQQYSGIVTPFVGLYKTHLQQKPKTMIELHSGKILVGMDGYQGAAPRISSLFLVQLDAQGNFDDNFGLYGGMMLENLTQTDEYISQIIQDRSGLLYLVGTSGRGMIFRIYTAQGLLVANHDYMQPGLQGKFIFFQSIDRVIIGGQDSLGLGHIYAYTSQGLLDRHFNSYGVQPGMIMSGEYNLQIGQLYDAVVDLFGTIYIVYQNKLTGSIDLTAFRSDGATVILTQTAIFGQSSIPTQTVGLAWKQDGNLVAAVCFQGKFLVATINLVDETLVLSNLQSYRICCSDVSVAMSHIVGCTDNSLLLLGYQHADQGIVMIRICPDGSLDRQFATTSKLPGIASIVVGQQIADYYARIGCTATVQSYSVHNQGGILVSGYEQMFDTDSLPLIFKLFGISGTQQVSYTQANVLQDQSLLKLPIMLDSSFNSTGIAMTHAVPQLDRIGNLILDEQKKIYLTGSSFAGYIFLARYGADGRLDTPDNGGTGFGTHGVVTIDCRVSDLIGAAAVLDAPAKRIYTASIAESNRFVLTCTTDEGLLDPTFAGGIVMSDKISNLVGHYSAIVMQYCDESQTGYPVVAGYCDSSRLIVMRYTPDGHIDQNFGQHGIVYVPIDDLAAPGGLVIDQFGNIVIAGSTNSKSIFVVKIDSAGNLCKDFGVNSVAYSLPSTVGYISAGSVISDNKGNSIVAGVTQDRSFMLVKFTPQGTLDESFGTLGVACSKMIPGVYAFGNCVLAQNDTILCGGLMMSYGNIPTMIMVQFSLDGMIDQHFVFQGYAATSPIPGLVAGGIVATNIAGDLFTAGLTTLPAFVIAKIAQRPQIVISDSIGLTPQNLKNYRYGNSGQYLIGMLNIQALSYVVTDSAVRLAVVKKVANVVDTYINFYQNQPDFNLIWHLYVWNSYFVAAQQGLIQAYPASLDQINYFFSLLFTRINNMKYNG